MRQMEERSLAREVAEVCTSVIVHLFSCQFPCLCVCMCVRRACLSAQNVLSEVTNRASQEMLITPKYLVPDTNCFVDMLPSIQSLVRRSEFIITVPLIGERERERVPLTTMCVCAVCLVVSELEGLSKGSPGTAGKAVKRNLAQVTTGAK